MPEADDYPSFMRAQSKNALKAMAAALKPPPEGEGEVAGTEPSPSNRAEIDALCADLEQREELSEPFVGQRIARAVARAHGLTFQEMISHRRNRHLAYARQEAMYLMCRYTSLSLPQIGKVLGGRDHTTILHGKRVHAHRLKARGGA